MLFPPSQNLTKETKHAVVFLFKLSLSPDSTTLPSLVCFHPHCNPYPRFYTPLLSAHLIKDLSPRDHITPTLKQLHWLPIHARIAVKISLFMYHLNSGTAPSYMSSTVTSFSASRSRGL